MYARQLIRGISKLIAGINLLVSSRPLYSTPLARSNFLKPIGALKERCRTLVLGMSRLKVNVNRANRVIDSYKIRITTSSLTDAPDIIHCYNLTFIKRAMKTCVGQ